MYTTPLWQMYLEQKFINVTVIKNFNFKESKTVDLFELLMGNAGIFHLTKKLGFYYTMKFSPLVIINGVERTY